MNITNHHINLVVAVFGVDPQNPYDLQLVTWIKGHFSQIEPFIVRSVEAGNKTFILEGYNQTFETLSDKEVFENIFKPLVGTVFSKIIRNLLGTENIVEVGEDYGHSKTYLVLVPAPALSEIKTDYKNSGFGLTTYQELVDLKKNSRKITRGI